MEKKSENTEKVKKSEQKKFPRLGRKLILGSVFMPFRFFSESNQIGSIEVEKMQILKIKL